MAISKLQPMRPAEIALIDELNTLSPNVEAMTELVTEIETVTDELQSDLTTLTNNVESLQDGFETVETTVENLQTSFTNLDGEITTKVNGLESTVNNLQTDFTNLNNTLSDKVNAVEESMDALNNNLGSMAYKNSIALNTQDISGTVLNDSQIAANGNIAYSIPLTIPDGFTPIAIRSIGVSGSQNSQLALRRWVLSNTNAEVTFKNVSSNAIDANSVSCTVHVTCIGLQIS